MATEVVKQAAERVHQRGERDSNMIRIREVSASRGKVMRAEPISLLYEKQRVLHRHGLDQLEGEMMAFSREWDRSVDGRTGSMDGVGPDPAVEGDYPHSNRLIVPDRR